MKPKVSLPIAIVIKNLCVEKVGEIRKMFILFLLILRFVWRYPLRRWTGLAEMSLVCPVMWS